MRRVFWVLVVLVMAVGFLVGCRSSAPVPTPSVSARDFNTRLGNMRLSLNAANLAEISTGVFNADRRNFDELDGWYTSSGTGFFGADELRKQTLLDGRNVRVSLRLCDNGRVEEARYSFNVFSSRNFLDMIDAYLNYSSFNFVGDNLRIESLTSSGGNVIIEEVVDEDAARYMFAVAIYNSDDLHLRFIWNFTNNHGDEASIVFSSFFSELVGTYSVVQSITFRPQ